MDQANWRNAKAAENLDKAIHTFIKRWWRFSYWTTVYTDHVVRTVYFNFAPYSIGLSLREDY